MNTLDEHMVELIQKINIDDFPMIKQRVNHIVKTQYKYRYENYGAPRARDSLNSYAQSRFEMFRSETERITLNREDVPRTVKKLIELGNFYLLYFLFLEQHTRIYNSPITSRDGNADLMCQDFTSYLLFALIYCIKTEEREDILRGKTYGDVTSEYKEYLETL